METIKSWLRVCARCSSLWGPRDLFCEGCWQHLWQEEDFRKGHFVTTEFPILVMWSWGKSGSLVETLVRAQKSTGLKRARHKIFQRLFTYPLGTKPSVVACVVPKDKMMDHAQEGAEVLAKMLGVRLIQLKIEPRVDYKQKGRRERNQWSGSIDPVTLKKTERVWFYDDVVTTGATVKAAWVALGKPKEFQVVALAFREL